MTIVTRIYLGIVAILLLALGSMILVMPIGFYAGYGLDLTGQPSLLNELRAPGLFMLGLGGFAVMGALRPRFQRPALWLAALFNLAYGLARLVGTVLDGMPHPGFVVAGVTELALGLLGLVLIWWLAPVQRARSAGEMVHANR